METSALGKTFHNGEVIVREGERGDCMFVIQSGEVEVVRENGAHKPIRLAVLHETDFFGEMALFDHEVRSATVRAVGDAQVLTVDRKSFLRRVHEDPSLAFRILQHLSQRIRQLDAEITKLKVSL
jgi:CRP/FNR family transcriptional regulator, cyclic AMP receptor protein